MAGAALPKLCFLYTLIFNGIVFADQQFRKGSVYCKEQSCTFKDGILDKNKATAFGTFNDTLLVSGWGVLDIVAGQGSAVQANKDVMFAAGFIEGAFTAEHMENNYANLVASMGLTKLLNEIRDWFRKQRLWANEMVEKKPLDSLWRHVSYVNAQLDGLYRGYRSVRQNNTNALDWYSVAFMTGVGDLLDLRYVLNPSSFPNWRQLSAKEAELAFYTSGHCSALIKLLPGFENIFMSHSSWFVYSATNRIYKNYDLNVKDEATATRKMSFSSYPGFLVSLDDFYLMDSGLVMLQTTNNIFNSALYKKVVPQSLMAWQRVRAANMIARNGREWTDLLGEFNSGTYNNQYMVIDLKQIELGSVVKDNALWVAEQIPGLVVNDDLTHLLRAGYFPSYNIPFFEEIYNRSGYPEMAKKPGAGQKYSYQLAPRAKIFRRDQSTVKDLTSMKAIMRYNDFKHDPYAGGSPWGAICSRGDLDPQNPVVDGCYDTKVTDFHMAKNLQAEAINGPTRGTNLPPFSWTGQWAGQPRAGLPEVYNFTFVGMKPRF
ncbi:phospholipase B-like [Elysia marginata]|uniref:Phospholipase B-like n=1 Tax=Elysia marginata TaxID=1093978 RepID=A0AAV4G1E2_9GAST|nr:phospholipase B-like [Elysia marginata]